MAADDVAAYLAANRHYRRARRRALRRLTAARLEALGESRDEDFSQWVRARSRRLHQWVKENPGDGEARERLAFELGNYSAQLETQALEMEEALRESPAQAANAAAEMAFFWAARHGTHNVAAPLRRIVLRTTPARPLPRARGRRARRIARNSRRCRSPGSRSSSREPHLVRRRVRHGRRAP